MQSSERTYLLGLDHLRAVAAFVVLFWHAVHIPMDSSYVPSNLVLSFLEEGHVGVSLFFCITGFIFTVLTHGRTIKYGPFLLNRFLRLFPLIFVTTLFGVWAEDFPKDSIALFFNLLGGGVAFGAWTLAVEFQFYIAYPFLRDRLESGGFRSLLLKAAGIILLFLSLRYAFFARTGNVQMAAYWTLFGRIDQFLFGIIAAHGYLAVRLMPRAKWLPWAWLATIGSIVAIVGAVHWFNLRGGFYFQGGYPSPSLIWLLWLDIEGILFATLIFGYCLVSAQWGGRVARAIAYLGAVSYSTYMLHFLMLPAVTSLLGKVGLSYSGAEFFLHQSVLVLIAFYPATIAVAALSYEFIEKPFLVRRHPYLVPIERTGRS